MNQSAIEYHRNKQIIESLDLVIDILNSLIGENIGNVLKQSFSLSVSEAIKEREQLIKKNKELFKQF